MRLHICTGRCTGSGCMQTGCLLFISHGRAGRSGSASAPGLRSSPRNFLAVAIRSTQAVQNAGWHCFYTSGYQLHVQKTGAVRPCRSWQRRRAPSRRPLIKGRACPLLGLSKNLKARAEKEILRGPDVPGLVERTMC